MGTKGRDACLWLFFMAFLAVVTAKGEARPAFLAVMIGLALLYLYYCAWYQPRAQRKCKGMGMEITLLLPVNICWSRLLLGSSLKTGFSKAFEVHVAEGRLSLGEFLRTLAHDLAIARRTFPGAAFMWETSAPLPAFVRRLIRGGSVNGTAFLKNGGWPLPPRFPLTARNLKKGRVSHGAIIV